MPQPEFDAAKLKLIPREFYNRDPRRVARALLGKVLVRRQGESLLAGRIVEVEAYLGAGDAAAHSAAGRTPRNSVLFGPPGYVYVYFIYGNHYCFNISCLPDGEAGGVLLRALEPLAGIDEMMKNRGMAGPATNLQALRMISSGPGRLAEALGITRERDNGKDVTSPASDLVVMEDGFRPKKVAITARIGITKSADELLRYVIAGNGFVSGKRAWIGNISPKIYRLFTPARTATDVLWLSEHGHG